MDIVDIIGNSIILTYINRFFTNRLPLSSPIHIARLLHETTTLQLQEALFLIGILAASNSWGYPALPGILGGTLFSIKPDPHLKSSFPFSAL